MKRTVLVHTADKSQLVRSYPGLLPESREGLRSFLSVPLISKGETIGTPHLRCKRANAYSARHLALADQLAGAIANALLHAGLQAAHEELRQAQASLEVVTQQLEIKNADLEDAHETRARFLSQVTQELRGPVTIMMGFAELMATNMHGNLTPEQISDLQMIWRNGELLDQLVEDLLDVSRVDSKKLQLVMDEFEAAELFVEIARSYSSILASKRQRLARRVPEETV